MDPLLDDLLPAYEFRSRYTREIDAEPARVWAAMRTLGQDDLPVTRLLMGIRSGGLLRRRSGGPVLGAGYLPVIAERAGDEVVVGTVAKFWHPIPPRGPRTTRTPEGFAAFAEPGWAKGAMSFRLTPLPGGRTLLAAETRVRATSTAARRAFAPYWLLIRVGGAGFLRLEMLRAVARRAERAPTPPRPPVRPA